MMCSTAAYWITNPGKWRLGTATKHSGVINFTLKVDRSSVDIDELDFDFTYAARRIHDRFSLYGEFDYDRNLGKTIKDEWSVLGKNDHFFTKKRYYSFSGFLEKDKGKGLDQRYYLGPALGYQFWESDEKNLRAEWGVYWTSTDLVDKEKRTGLGTGWFIDYDQYIYKRAFQFYHRQNSVLSNRENMNFKSKTGLRLPVYSGFLASAEIEANWDAETAENRDDTEVITRIKLGYGW
jgi:putative salt-induced outer membrane protein YdiY